MSLIAPSLRTVHNRFVKKERNCSRRKVNAVHSVFPALQTALLSLVSCLFVKLERNSSPQRVNVVLSVSQPLLDQTALLYCACLQSVNLDRWVLCRKVNVAPHVFLIAPPSYVQYHRFARKEKSLSHRRDNAAQCVDQCARSKDKPSVPVHLHVPPPAMILAQKSAQLSVSKDVHVPLVRWLTTWIKSASHQMNAQVSGVILTTNH